MRVFRTETALKNKDSLIEQMQVFYDINDFYPEKPVVATIGTYDGVHLGHKKILQRLKDIAAEIGGETVLISFHPHPRLVLFPDKTPVFMLQNIAEKITVLREFGIDKLLLIPFTKEFSQTSSDTFIRQILVEKVRIHRLVIGYDHHFGANRSGDIHELRQYAAECNYEVEEIPAQAIDNANVSSTKVRQALQAGDIHTANSFLGYDFHFSGKVVHGQKQGRLLGYPTANLDLQDKYKLIPANGIYFVRVFVEEVAYFGMMSIGVKPTMGDFARGIEVNIFDFDKDIYDNMLKIEVLAYIRAEAKFDSLATLIEAIEGDKAFCMDFISRRFSQI